MSACVWKRLWHVCIVASALALAALGVAAQAPTVAEIAITGNDHISTEAIMAVVTLKPGAEVTPAAIENDRKAIADMGYFGEVTARTEDTSGGAKVIYDVVENPMIKGLKLEGTGPIPESELLPLLRTRVDNVLNSKSLDQDAEAIRRQYRDKGYLADVEPVNIDRETGVLTIPIVAMIIQKIDIVGNKKTPDYIFLREMKSKPGQYFNATQVRKDLLKIYELEILDREAAEEPQLEPGTDPDKVLVNIRVKEKKTGQVSVGLGYSSSQKIVGRAELTENNFRGKGQGVNATWEVGGTSRGSSIELGFYEPWLDRKHTSLNVSIFDKLVYRFTSNALTGGSNLGNEEDYNERRKGGSFGFGRPLSEFNTAFVSFRGESVGVGIAKSILEAKDKDGNPTSDLPLISEDGKVYSTTLKWVGNTRDFDLDPAIGTYKSVSLDLGSLRDRKGYRTWSGTEWVQEPLRDGMFTKGILEFRRYFSHGGRKLDVKDKRRTIAVRVMVGVESGAIMFSEQFFVGGAESVRGYREDRFWGTKMLVANVEYRVPVANSLTGVLFMDWGDAWGGEILPFPGPFKDLPQHTKFDPVASAGIGVRVRTPLGNIRLDYGFGSEGSRTHFSIGHAF